MSASRPARRVRGSLRRAIGGVLEVSTRLGAVGEVNCSVGGARSASYLADVAWRFRGS